METDKKEIVGDEDNGFIFQNLTKWIENAGGHVNPSLELRARSSDSSTGFKGQKWRGLYAAKPILEGDVLIRLPSELAISGEKLPNKWGKDNRMASPWLRCLACLYLAQDDPHWEPYIASLPAEFETLWQWTDDEIGFLDGTTLGQTLRNEKEEDALELRYQQSVKPFLKHLKIPEISEKSDGNDPMSLFKRVSMCISTRGFHMQPPDQEKELEKAKPGDSELDKKPSARSTAELNHQPEAILGTYLGPYLLPAIDLLNHAVVNKATTLQRDEATKSFYMVAERDIAAGEEVTHSYGDKLTAAQILQTFGFVPEARIRGAVSEDLWGVVRNKTPAVLSKEDLIEGCRSVVKSNYPKELKKAMEENDIGGETWELKFYSEKERNLTCLPDQYLITASTSCNCLSDEIVTLCCIHLLPDYVYDEIFGEEPKLLDQGVLEDYFLGKLVVMSILTAIKKRLAAYKSIKCDFPGVEEENMIDDKAILKALLRLNEHNSRSTRAMYGLTVRLEEKKGLEELRNEVVAVIACLDDEEAEDGDDAMDETPYDSVRPTKKQKTDE